MARPPCIVVPAGCLRELVAATRAAHGGGFVVHEARRTAALPAWNRRPSRGAVGPCRCWNCPVTGPQEPPGTEKGSVPARDRALTRVGPGRGPGPPVLLGTSGTSAMVGHAGSHYPKARQPVSRPPPSCVLLRAPPSGQLPFMPRVNPLRVPRTRSSGVWYCMRSTPSEPVGSSPTSPVLEVVTERYDVGCRTRGRSRRISCHPCCSRRRAARRSPRELPPGSLAPVTRLSRNLERQPVVAVQAGEGSSGCGRAHQATASDLRRFPTDAGTKPQSTG
jgi:hypothetical protein